MNDSRRKIQVQMDCHYPSPCCLLLWMDFFHCISPFHQVQIQEIVICKWLGKRLLLKVCDCLLKNMERELLNHSSTT